MEKVKCSKCGEMVPAIETNADDECEICAALASLRATLEKRGLMHADLFEQGRSSLPAGDRE